MSIWYSIAKRLTGLSLAALGLCGSLSAGAASTEITAVFKPDPANPMQNRFVNTTPNSQFCHHFVVLCKPRNMFSLIVQGVPYEQTTGGPVEANHTNPRLGAYLKVPSEWRQISVVSDTPGSKPEIVEVRIAGIGGRHDLYANATDLTGGIGDSALWSIGRWSNAPSPCIGSGFITGTDYFVNFMWLVPENAGACFTQAKFAIPKFLYRYIEFAYELRTPNPLGMSTGTYRGSIPYTMGPSGDFDFGDLVLPKDNLLMLNFTLEVQHELKVEVPPGGNRVELVPPGGWQAWVNKGRKPERLFRDQTFNISASSRFKMRLECDYNHGNNCALGGASGVERVQLNVSVSLPSGLSDASGAPVERRPLLRDGSGTELFQPSFYVERKPGTLHFEVDPRDVEWMLDPWQSKKYSGNVTVIWDSEV
ncbi:hypothetical protein [Pseudomonas sp. Leaf48]|uniref:hypothetical protein n=1 Tax=Pseudomonas sp. Leaf48 TaxID=1736221 RepID=UPI000A3F3085|nr:hypothetical protein [Pseudomonas sp. Leaf48]